MQGEAAKGRGCFMGAHFCKGGGAMKKSGVALTRALRNNALSKPLATL